MNWETVKESILHAAAQMTWIEAVAVFFSLVYVFLAAREMIWCWAAALVSVCLYIYICLRAQLYAETALQVFYLAMAFYGWFNWNKRKEAGKRPIISWPAVYHIAAVSAGLVLFLTAGYALDRHTDAALPYLDSFTTWFAVIATFMVARKVLENWIYWVIIDGASIYLYMFRDLYLTALLFLAYTVIAAFGYFQWRSIYRTRT